MGGKKCYPVLDRDSDRRPFSPFSKPTGLGEIMLNGHMDVVVGQKNNAFT